MARRSPPRKVTYFEPRLARNTIIESTFEVGRRFRCTMRVDCGELDPGAVIRPVPEEWHPRMPQRLDEEELADWRAGRNAVYQLAALTIGARLAVADCIKPGLRERKTPAGEGRGFQAGRSTWGDFDRPRASNSIDQRSSRLIILPRQRRATGAAPAADLGRRLVLAQALVYYLPQQIVVGPGQET
jgi:hypothetical protein